MAQRSVLLCLCLLGIFTSSLTAGLLDRIKAYLSSQPHTQYVEMEEYQQPSKVDIYQTYVELSQDAVQKRLYQFGLEKHCSSMQASVISPIIKYLYTSLLVLCT